MRPPFRSLGGLACAVVLALSTLAPAALAANVSIGDFFFNPETVTINVGESVTWTNNGAVPHTVDGDGGLSSGQLATSQSYSRTFNSAGTFNYHCRNHGQMTGEVVVQGAAPPATTAAPATTTLRNTTTTRAPTTSAPTTTESPATDDEPTTTSPSSSSTTSTTDDDGTEVAADEAASSGNGAIGLVIFALALLVAGGIGALLWRRRGVQGSDAA